LWDVPTEQIAKQQYEIKALADSQVKVQPKTSESYRTIIEALADKHADYTHTHTSIFFFLRLAFTIKLDDHIVYSEC
jgi:hypothetical protein